MYESAKDFLFPLKFCRVRCVCISLAESGQVCPCQFTSALVPSLKPNVVLTGLGKDVKGNGFKMLFGKWHRNSCSFGAIFYLGINSESLLGTGKCFNVGCNLCPFLNWITVRIHDQGPEELQDKQYHKTEGKMLSFIFDYTWLKSYYAGFRRPAMQSNQTEHLNIVLWMLMYFRAL